MKINFTLIISFLSISLFSAQTNAEKHHKRSPQKANFTNTESLVQPRSVECIWESDFSNSNEWDIAHDTEDCSLDWEIGENLENSGFYPTNPIVSANGFYAMIDSDNYGGEEGGTEVEDSWLTMANPVNCSGIDNVVVEFDTWYRRYTSERCFLVVSTDGTFPNDLTPDTEEDPANGIYEVFPEMDSSGDALVDNPTTRKINISESAGGQSQVWIRFNWTGTWGYTWMIDRVCVAEQPADDISLSYGIVSHNGTAEEYGMIPSSQLDAQPATTGGEVYNFGVNDATSVELTMEVSNSSGDVIVTQDGYPMYGAGADGLLDLTTPITGPVASDNTVYFEDETPMSGVDEDVYTATFTATSSADNNGGEFFVDNSTTREFAITNGLYATDGIGVYSNPNVDSWGTGQLTDGSVSDGLIMMSYYDISSTTSLGGVWIGLDSYLLQSPQTVPGGEIVVALRDTTLISNETFDPTNVIASSDFYLVTQQDIDNGYIVVPFSNNITLNPNAYYITVEMYSNGNSTDIFILDDETVPQPYYFSMIFVPGEQVYSDGNAFAIRMITDGAISDIISLEENNLEYNIFPNPSSGSINIELGEQGEFNVEISDIIGKSIYNNIIKTNTNIDINGLDTGVYFVTISNENKSNTTKLIVE